MNSPVIINFCPTGMVPTKINNSHVPISPSEIIEQTHEAYEIGITIAHLHAREADQMSTDKASVLIDFLRHPKTLSRFGDMCY